MLVAKQDARLAASESIQVVTVDRLDTLSYAGAYSVNYFCNLLCPHRATAYSVYLLRMMYVWNAQESRLVAVSRKTSSLHLAARLSRCISIE